VNWGDWELDGAASEDEPRYEDQRWIGDGSILRLEDHPGMGVPVPLERLQVIKKETETIWRITDVNIRSVTSTFLEDRPDLARSSGIFPLNTCLLLVAGSRP